MPQTDLVLTLVNEDPVPPRVGLIILNRPQARNALSAEMVAGLSTALEAVDADATVDVVVLTGTGSAFCAGLDLKQMAATGANLRPADGRPWPKITKPIIAAINGPAITGGLELALSCDFLVASTDARFADTHTRVGLVPFWGLSVLLPEAIGSRNARFMSLTGQVIPADVAQRMGLVSAVVPPDDLLSTTLAMASEIASADQPATRSIIAQYRGSAASSAEFDAEIQAATHFLEGGIDAAVIEYRRQNVMVRNRAAME